MTRSALTVPLGFIMPEIPALVPEPPSGKGWIHEIKYDGYRTLIVIDRGQARAFTRNGNDWTTAYRRVVDAAGKLACKTAVLDGEVVVQVLKPSGRPSTRRRTASCSLPSISSTRWPGSAENPSHKRRAALRGLMQPDPRSPIQFSDHLEGDGARTLSKLARRVKEAA
jgi:ATP-dependent DNA ligase